MPKRSRRPIIPKKDRFALWKLPDIARSMVIQKMDPGTVIDLSIKYKAFKRFLMCYKLSCQEMTFNFLFDDPQVPRWKWFFDIDNIGISVYFPHADQLIRFMCRIPQTPFDDYERPHKPDITRNGMCGDYYVGEAFDYKDKLFEVELLARHFMDILSIGRIELDHVCVKDYEILSDCFVWKLVDKFDEVLIRQRFHSDYDIPNDHLKFLTNDLNVDELKLWVDVEEPDKLSGINLKARKIEAKNPNWLKMDHVINSECEHIVIEHMTVEPEEVLDVVIKWMSGEKLKKLVKFEANFNGNQYTNLEKELMDVVDKMDGAERVTQEELERLSEKAQGHSYAFHKNSRKIHCVADRKMAVFGIMSNWVKFHLI